MVSAEIQFIPPAFAGAGSRFAARLHPCFAPIATAIGLALDAQTHQQLDAPSSRGPVKYPG